MRKSKGTLNLARTQAARADVDTFDLTVNNSADTLDVRLPGTFRLQVGVADVVAGQLAFCTKLANICHVLHLLHTQGHSGPQTQYKYSTTNDETMQVFLLDKSLRQSSPPRNTREDCDAPRAASQRAACGTTLLPDG